MEHAWIPMKDGIRLAATLYMPDGAKAGEDNPSFLNGAVFQSRLSSAFRRNAASAASLKPARGNSLRTTDSSMR